MKLKKMWKLARQEQFLVKMAYHLNHIGEESAHKAACARRDLFIEMIFNHKKNPYSRLAIMSRIIDGLSGKEHELKPGFDAPRWMRDVP